MTIAGVPIANGTLSTTSLTTLYTATARIYISLANFIVPRTHTGLTQLEFLVRTDGTNDIHIFDYDLSPGDRVREEAGITLESGDILKAQTDQSGIIWALFAGVEQ